MASSVAFAIIILALEFAVANAIRDEAAAGRSVTPIVSEDSDVQDAPNVLPARDRNKAIDIRRLAVEPYRSPSKEEISSLYTELGCFDLEEHDPGNEGDKVALLDSYCRDFNRTNSKFEGQKCRSGLPFFRRPLQRSTQAFTECMDFCLQSGLDVFGLVDTASDPPLTIECRCGVSGHNLQIWQQVAEEKDYLIADLQRQGSSETCSVRMGMYDPEWMEQHKHGTPISLLKKSVVTVRYIAHILRGTRQPLDGDEFMAQPVAPENMDWTWFDAQLMSSSLLENQVQHEKNRRQQRADERHFDCSRGYCSAGEPWGPQIHFAFTKEVDSIRMEAYKLALSKITAKVPCLGFVEFHCKNSQGVSRPGGRCLESDFQGSGNQAEVQGVILVGNREPKDDQSGCYSAGVGFPGQYRMRFINLGWCSSQLHYGEMMHVTLLALGVGHEHRRPDAAFESPWGGPYLEVKWDKIKLASTKQWAKKNKRLELSAEQIAVRVQLDVWRYMPNEISYVGSKPRGGYVPFDYGSIMMPAATLAVRSARRRSSQASLPGCSNSVFCLDHLMGQRTDLSVEDVLQLRDLYGCLPPIAAQCPMLYGGGQADEEGDCACPAGTTCYNGNTKGCPFHNPEVLHENFFSANCSSCRCVAMSCAANAEAATQAPDSDGNCRCPATTHCWQGGHRGCFSSRSSHDIEFFAGSCFDCKCVAKCPAASNARDLLVDANGDCHCRQSAVCRTVSGLEVGCPSSRGQVSLRYFSPALCNGGCMCEDELEPQLPMCTRGNQNGADTHLIHGTPEEMGDCECQVNAVCKRAGGYLCPYSGGLSRRYFLATCLDCFCIPIDLWFGGPLIGTLPSLQRREMHLRCATGPMPAKCGATMLRIGDDVVSLGGLDLGLDECGRCIFARPAGGRDGQQWSSCQLSTRGFDLETRYMLVESGPLKDLCCAKYACTEDYTYDPAAPCKNYKCATKDAFCQEDCSTGETRPTCVCKENYEFSDDKEECVPIIPKDARCCRFEGSYMWVAYEHLKVQKALGMIATGKRTCPKIGNNQWKHGPDAFCDRDSKKLRFLYRGDGKTSEFY